MELFLTGKLKFWRLSTGALRRTASYSGCRCTVRRLNVQRWSSGRLQLFLYIFWFIINCFLECGREWTHLNLVYRCFLWRHWLLHYKMTNKKNQKETNMNAFPKIYFKTQMLFSGIRLSHISSRVYNCLLYVSYRVMLSTAELHWESSGFSTALPLLLQALALARQHHLQSLASETILHLAFTQVSHSRRTDFTVAAPIYANRQSRFLHCGWRMWIYGV